MKVSVILPVYNGEKYLAGCMDSLLEQTIKDYEVICVDDGSVDGSREILDEYMEKNPDIVRVFHKVNEGVYKAREYGLKQAKGEYVGFCDCDDIVDAEMYSKLYACATREQAAMSVCAYIRVDAGSGKTLCREMGQFGDSSFDVQGNKDRLAVINTALWNKLIRRDVALKHIRFDKAPRVAEDMMFLLSLYPRIERMSFCSEPLYRYYVRDGSAMSHIEPGEIEHLKACMVQTKKFVQEQGAGWEDVVNAFSFIHFGIVLFVKSGISGKQLDAMQKGMREWLDVEFDGWDRNPYLSCRHVLGGHFVVVKPMIVLWMYRVRMFPIFLHVYVWMTGRMGIDIKW